MKRVELIQGILWELSAGRSVLVTGDKGSGKSWLLGSVARQLQGAWYFESVGNKKAQLLEFARKLHQEEQNNPGVMVGEILEGVAQYPDWSDVEKELKGYGQPELLAAIMPCLAGRVLVFDMLNKATETKINDVILPLINGGVTLLLAGRDEQATDSKILGMVRNKCAQFEMPAFEKEEAVAMLWSLLDKQQFPTWRALEAKVLNLYNGKPGVVADLAAQMSGTAGSMQDVRNISHSDSEPINLTWPTFFVVLGLAAVTRFTSRQLDDPTIYVIAGTAYVAMMIVPRLWGAKNKM